VGRRIALLIGNQTFLEESKLEPLSGPVNDVEAMADVLQNAALGNFEVQKIVEQPHYEVTRAIVETLQAAKSDDFVLIFYSGHGKLSGSGKLYLATANTTQKALQATTVPAWSLHEAVSESDCQEVVLLLDCCYSGAVSQGLKGDLASQLEAVQNAAGFFILTASTDIQRASENETDAGGKVMGRFTTAIVEGIRTGDARDQATGRIHLSHLKAYVERKLRGSTPQFFAHRGSGDPLISNGSQPSLDPGVMADLNDGQWHRRLGAVRYFANVLRSGQPLEVKAVRAALAARLNVERDVDVRQAISDAIGAQSEDEADVSREKMLRGAHIVANTVKVTLGPKGRMVVIGKKGGVPRSTKNCVSIVKEIERSDPYENLGAQFMCELAVKTDDDAGGGAATALVLAQAMIDGGAKAVAAGRNSMDLKDGIDLAVARLIEEIKAGARKISSPAEIIEIGTIAADGDKVVGEVIARAIEKVGREGVILVEETDIADTQIEIMAGTQFKRGYLSPYFVTNTEKLIAELENPYILVHDKKLSALQALLPLLEAVVQSSRPLLIIAEDVEGEALATLVVNKLRGGLKVAAVKAPGFGAPRKAMLEDIAVLTNGRLISEELGIKLENVTLDMLGTARKVVLTKQATTIVCDRGKPQEHPAKIEGDVAVIQVGGASEVEVKQRRDLIDGALKATHAALEEGIVLGGGVALLRAARVLDDLQSENEDQGAGIAIVRAAAEAPLRQIAENAGVQGLVVVARILESSSPDFGFNAQTKEYLDLRRAGILDPAKMVRLAIREAALAAGLLITTDMALFKAGKPDDAVPEAGRDGAKADD
jgi:chaperonin GroEL